MKIIYDLPDDNLSKIKQLNIYKFLLTVGIVILILSMITFIVGGVLAYVVNNPAPNATAKDLSQLGGASSLLFGFGYGFGFLGLD